MQCHGENYLGIFKIERMDGMQEGDGFHIASFTALIPAQA
jgi:hypothetical protein